MSKKDQVDKNLELSEKLAEYLAKDPPEVKGMPKKSAFITFSLTDQELNKLNNKLVNSYSEKGKTVVKAQETKDEKKPWKFTPIVYV